MIDPTPKTESSEEENFRHLEILQRARDQARSEADRWQRRVDEQMAKMRLQNNSLY